MTTATYVPFNAFIEAAMEGKHNLGADSLVVWLSNTAPTASTDDTIADITEISYTNCSSRAVTVTSSAQSSGTYKLVLQDLVLTASGAVGPFRYAGVFNDTATNDGLVGGYYDYGSSITLASGDTFTIDFDGTSGFFSVAAS